MTIHEAAKLANELGTGFHPVGPNGTMKHIIIVPTDTAGLCLIQHVDITYKPGDRWVPGLKDLISNEYQVYGADGDADPAVLERVKEMRENGDEIFFKRIEKRRKPVTEPDS